MGRVSKIAVSSVAAIGAAVLLVVFLGRSRSNPDLDVTNPSRPSIVKQPSLSQERGILASGRLPPPRVAWRPKLESLRKDLEDSLSKGDYVSARKLAHALAAEASEEESSAVKVYVNAVLSQIADKRRSEAYAPLRQSISLAEARTILEQLTRVQDTRAREDLYSQLQSSRLPDEVLPEVVNHLQAKIRESEENKKYLWLLNSFVSPDSSAALFKFVDPSYGKSVRLEALGLLSQRPCTGDQAVALSRILSSEGDDDVRATLMMQIADSPQPELRALVRNALSDPSDKLRAVATSTLDTTKEEDRGKLLQLAQSDTGESVRLSAFQQLARGLNEPSALKAVLFAAENDSSEKVRIATVRILGRSSPEHFPDVLPALERISESTASEEVSSLAKTILHRLSRSK